MSVQERFPSDWFPFGATLVSTMTRWAHPWQSLEEWTKEAHFDLERMVGHGMTAVGVMMDWELIEPQEGKFDFSRHDPIMDKAAKLGLKAILWPWEEVGPHWLPRNHPDWLWEADDGHRIQAGCWHHPEFRNRVHRFITNVVERYRDNPAMLMWNVAIEPHYRPGWEEFVGERDKLYCYHPATVERYRQWLKRVFQDELDRLNRRWMMYYTSWDQVLPPRGGSYNLNSPRYFDWRMFWIEALADYQGGKSDLVRRLDPKHPTTGNSGWFPSPAFAGLGLHKIAARFDSFGISLFPVYRWGRSSQVTNNLSYCLVYSACHPDKPAIAHELQGGPMAHGPVFGEVPNPEEIRQWCWQAVGNGYKGIFFWAWRHHRTTTEMGGFGLCNMDGSDTDRTKVASDVGRQLQASAPILQRLNRVRPRVAILYSDRNIIVNQMAGRLGSFEHGTCTDSLHTTGVEGYFEVFYRLRIPVYLMIEEQLKELIGGNLAHIQALVIPYLPMISKENLAILEQFVRRGGLIWSDPWLAQRDEANVGRMHVPGDSLKNLFGCVQGDVRPILADTPHNRKNLWRGMFRIGNGRCRVELSGMAPLKLPSLLHEVPLTPVDGGEVLGVFDNESPALIRKRHGKSATYYCGSYFGITARQDFTGTGWFEEDTTQKIEPASVGSKESGLKILLGQVLAEHGIGPEVESVGGDSLDMEAHLLTGTNEALAIFLNFSPEHHVGEWSVRVGFDSSGAKATDLQNRKPVDIVRRNGNSVDLKIDLPWYGVAAVHVTR